MNKEEPKDAFNSCSSCGQEDWRINYTELVGCGHYEVFEICRHCGLSRRREENLMEDEK